MRWLIAALFAAHAIAHGVGFAVNWQLISNPEVPFTTVVLGGRWDVGGGGIRLVGLVWLVAAAAFLIAAAAIAVEARWAFGATIAALVLSLLMCVVGWPAARVGLYLNLALVAVLLLSSVLGWGWFSATTQEARHVAPDNSLSR